MISKSEDAVTVTTAGVDVQPGGLVIVPMDHKIVTQPVEDMATRLARLARDENTWEGARAALLRAMRLTREWERDERERAQQQNGE